MFIVKPRRFQSPLRKEFAGAVDASFSYSQAWQDIFVLVALDGLVGGRYLEIGAGDARNINNTYLLEKYFGWTGLSLDIDPKAIRSYKLHRKNRCIQVDACQTDFARLLSKAEFGTGLDYLQVDIEPNSNSLIALKNFMKSGIRPRVVTFETDFYDPNTPLEISRQVRQESRDLMQGHGYELVAGDIGNTSAADPFEDWYVDPSQVEMSRLQNLMTLSKEARASEVVLFKGPFIIATEFYDGQGLGNQLWTYVATRLAAMRQGFDFGIGGKQNFKGDSFIEIDLGKTITGGLTNDGGPPSKLPSGINHYYSETKIIDRVSGLDVSKEDKRIWTLPPNSKIDGNFQSFEYLKGNEDVVRSWIQIQSKRSKELVPNDNSCVIHVRGGDFKSLNLTSLGFEYYRNAIAFLRSNYGITHFVAITDDTDFAKAILPDYVDISQLARVVKRDRRQARHHIGHDVEGDFLTLMQAKYLIISNSSFSWWAAFLNTRRQVVLAPKYWAAYNSNSPIWSTGEIVTPGFTYMDVNGHTFSAEDCIQEINIEEGKNQTLVYEGSSKLSTLTKHFLGRFGYWRYLFEFHLVHTIGHRLRRN